MDRAVDRASPLSVFFLNRQKPRAKETVGGGLPGLRGFSVVFIVRCSLTIHCVSGEREYTTHTNTTPQHAASQACLLHDGDVLRVLSACFCCLPLGVGSKASGWKRGRQGRRRRRQGAGGSAMPRCVPMFVRGGRCTPRIRPGGGEESDGDGGGRDRGSGGDPGMVATAASAMQPARRGDRWARPLRAVRVRTTKQL